VRPDPIEEDSDIGMAVERIATDIDIPDGLARVAKRLANRLRAFGNELAVRAAPPRLVEASRLGELAVELLVILPHRCLLFRV